MQQFDPLFNGESPERNLLSDHIEGCLPHRVLHIPSALNDGRQAVAGRGNGGQDDTTYFHIRVSRHKDDIGCGNTNTI